MPLYRCVTNCTYGKPPRLYEEGDDLVVQGGEKPPAHFKLIDKGGGSEPVGDQEPFLADGKTARCQFVSPDSGKQCRKRAMDGLEYCEDHAEAATQ